MRILFKLYNYYAYVAAAIVVILILSAFIANKVIVEERIDALLDDQYDEIESELEYGLINVEDTLWGSNWFIVLQPDSVNVDEAATVEIPDGERTRCFRKIERTFELNAENIKVGVWIEIDMSAFSMLLYILFPVIIFLLILGYIALVEFIHYKSWEQLNFVSSLFENLSIVKDALMQLEESEIRVIEELITVIDFISERQRLKNSRSFKDMERIFGFMINKYELALANNIAVNNKVEEFVGVIRVFV